MSVLFCSEPTQKASGINRAEGQGISHICYQTTAATRQLKLVLERLLLLIARGNPNAEPNYLPGIVTPLLRQFAAAARLKIALSRWPRSDFLARGEPTLAEGGRRLAAQDANS